MEGDATYVGVKSDLCQSHWSMKKRSRSLAYSAYSKSMLRTISMLGFNSHSRQMLNIIEPRHEISNNVVCATSEASDQHAHMRSLLRAFASHLNIP